MKLQIIENCIYAVDIETSAVDIATLYSLSVSSKFATILWTPVSFGLSNTFLIAYGKFKFTNIIKM